MGWLQYGPSGQVGMDSVLGHDYCMHVSIFSNNGDTAGQRPSSKVTGACFNADSRRFNAVVALINPHVDAVSGHMEALAAKANTRVLDFASKLKKKTMEHASGHQKTGKQVERLLNSRTRAETLADLSTDTAGMARVIGTPHPRFLMAFAM